MAKRGRTSMAELMVPENSLEVIQRPDAPYDLTDEESDEWRGIIRSMPADHFTRGNYPLLAQLCRHIVAARRIAQMITVCLKTKPFVQRQYTALLAHQASESVQITRLSRAMRLTQQSTKKAESVNLKANPAADSMPWHDEDGDDE